MYELRVVVRKVMGVCTSDPPLEPGDFFTVRDGSIRIPEGSSVCVWALQNLLPVILLKEREILEEPDADWVWRVHHVQCPDPAGRVIFEIERVGVLDRQARKAGQVKGSGDPAEIDSLVGTSPSQESLCDLRVVVEEVRGKCTLGMRLGDFFVLHGGRLFIPPQRHFCLYALHAALPLLPAKQRPLKDGDWLKEEAHIICPDPAGNVVMRIEPYS